MSPASRGFLAGPFSCKTFARRAGAFLPGCFLAKNEPGECPANVQQFPKNKEFMRLVKKNTAEGAHGIRGSQFLSVGAAGPSRDPKFPPSGNESLISYRSSFLIVVLSTPST